MPGHQGERGIAPLGIGGKLPQLDRETFLQATRRDPGRIEVLDLAKYRFDLFEGHFPALGIETLLDVFESQREIAVVVDGVDQRGCDHPVGVAEPHQGTSASGEDP